MSQSLGYPLLVEEPALHALQFLIAWSKTRACLAFTRPFASTCWRWAKELTEEIRKLISKDLCRRALGGVGVETAVE
jgi:hypothetical protein